MVCFITVTILWVFSVCLHEFSHALEPVNQFFWGVVNGVTATLGVDPRLAYAGFDAFRFWQ